MRSTTRNHRPARTAVGALLAMLVLAGTALADPGDPQQFRIDGHDPFFAVRHGQLTPKNDKGKKFEGTGQLWFYAAEGTAITDTLTAGAIDLKVKLEYDKKKDKYKYKFKTEKGVFPKVEIELKVYVDEMPMRVKKLKFKHKQIDGTKIKIKDEESIAPGEVLLVASAAPTLDYLSSDSGDLLRVSVEHVDGTLVASDETPLVPPANPLYQDPVLWVPAGSAYVLVAEYANGHALRALVPPLRHDEVVGVNLATEIIYNLVRATEGTEAPPAEWTPSRPVADSYSDAFAAVEKLVAFIQDRNENRDVDRVVDAVRSLTLDYLHRGRVVESADLTEDAIRAYGGGIGAVPPLEELIATPRPPLTPLLVATLGSASANRIVVYQDSERWDARDAVDTWHPIGTVGGRSLAFVRTDWDLHPGASFSRVWTRDLGSDDAATPLTPTSIDATEPSWSPDQSRLVFAGYTQSDWTDFHTRSATNLYLINADGTGLEKLTHGTATIPDFVFVGVNNSLPAWSPDGSEIAFVRHERRPNGTQTWRIDRINVDGTDRRTLFDLSNVALAECGNIVWAPDSRSVIFDAWTANYNVKLVIEVSAQAGGPPPREITRERDPGTVLLRSISTGGNYVLVERDTDEWAYQVLDRYTGEMEIEWPARLNSTDTWDDMLWLTTDLVLAPQPGQTLDSNGRVVIDPNDDGRTGNGSSGVLNSAYYQEIWGAANGAGIDFSTGGW